MWKLLNFTAESWLRIDSINDIFILKEGENLSDNKKNSIEHLQLLHLHHHRIFHL
jgi:hypothetical protein